MREMILVLVPIAVVVYFFRYPDQWNALGEWLASLLRHLQ
jgi:hypothetical protein